MTQAGRAVGRPRNSDVDRRAIEAALALYRERGLNGVSFEQVSRVASVGKASLYSRWDTAEALLVDALRSVTASNVPEAIDTGTFEGDLRKFIFNLIDLYVGPDGPVAIRINLDAQVAPTLRPYYNEFVKAYLDSASELVRRAVERGEIRPEQDPSVIIEQLIGATMLHVHFSTPDRTISMSQASTFAESLVQNLLYGSALR